MYNVSPLEGIVKFYLLDCEPFRSDLLLVFAGVSIFYVHTVMIQITALDNKFIVFFYLALIRFHKKFGEDKKDN